jgi:hypothetical protein
MLKTSFNDAFVSHLCQEIHQSIQDGGVSWNCSTRNW